MLVGYARVSTGDQKLDLQLDALRAAGCERTFTDQISGSKSERLGLQEALDYVRAGDTLVVWRLDRFGRSLKDLVAKVEELKGREVGFRSLQESIDTTSSTGKLIFHIFGALAEFERDLVRERTMAGLASARARGRKGGRPRSMDASKIKLATRLMKDRNYQWRRSARPWEYRQRPYIGTSHRTERCGSSDGDCWCLACIITRIWAVAQDLIRRYVRYQEEEERKRERQRSGYDLFS